MICSSIMFSSTHSLDRQWKVVIEPVSWHFVSMADMHVHCWHALDTECLSTQPKQLISAADTDKELILQVCMWKWVWDTFAAWVIWPVLLRCRLRSTSWVFPSSSTILIKLVLIQSLQKSLDGCHVGGKAWQPFSWPHPSGDSPRDLEAFYLFYLFFPFVNRPPHASKTIQTKT